MQREKDRLQAFIREQVSAYRAQNKMSQERMAELLHISLRSYSGQERGEYGFSALSLVRFVLSMSADDRELFFVDCAEALKGEDIDAA